MYRSRRNDIKTKYPKALCFNTGKQIERRYAVKLEAGGIIIASGRSPAQAWCRAYEFLTHGGYL